MAGAAGSPAAGSPAAGWPAAETSPAEQTAGEVPVAAQRNAGPRILVVEDNPINLEVAVGMLESLGCSTEAATTAGSPSRR